MNKFITVSSEVLESLEKIVHSGLRGTHLLFTNSMIRQAYTREMQLDLLEDQDLVEQVQEVLADLLEIEDLDERRDYIESLDRDLRDVLVHLYFGFLDRYMDDEKSSEVLH